MLLPIAPKISSASNSLVSLHINYSSFSPEIDRFAEDFCESLFISSTPSPLLGLKVNITAYPEPPPTTAAAGTGLSIMTVLLPTSYFKVLRWCYQLGITCLPLANPCEENPGHSVELNLCKFGVESVNQGL